MTLGRHTLINDLDMLPQIPAWITSAQAKSLEETAFLSGGALNHLCVMLATTDIPQALLRERLALRAAEICVAISGRPERAAELRDEVHLLRAGDLPGPAGETYFAWRRAVERPISVQTLHRALPAINVHLIDELFDLCRGSPMTHAATIMEKVLTEVPRSEVAGLILTDAALARALGWDHVLPLLALGLKRTDLRKRGDDLRMAYYRAVVTSVIEAVRLSADLTRRAAQLRTVAPKLRAKGAGEALKMFLTQDAIAPTALPLSDRAARRLCDRLVNLGAVRELTGRDTFRLYGV